MKCGTNTLGKLIPMHPRVVISKCRGHAEPMNPLATPEECAYPAYQQQPDVALRGYRAFQGRAIDDEERARNGTDEFWEQHFFTYLTTNAYPKVNYLSEDALAGYSELLPQNDRLQTMTVEKSPSYLDTPYFKGLPARVKQLLPNAKIAFSICDPVTRLYSEWEHTMRWEREAWKSQWVDAKETAPATLPELINKLKPGSDFCNKKPDYCFNKNKFIRKGDFVDHIRDWQAALGEDNVLVTVMNAPVETTARQLIEFVDLPESEFPWDELKTAGPAFHVRTATYKGRGGGWAKHPEEMRWLAQRFRLKNSELAEQAWFHGQQWMAGWGKPPNATNTTA